MRNLLIFTTAAVSLALPGIQPETQAQSSPSSSSLQSGGPITAIPSLIRFSAVLSGEGGKPGRASLTFLIFADEKAGEPLWMETREVAVDASGRYEVNLGSATSAGLPADLFSSPSPRWLEVQPAGQPAEPRRLLTSVPYALKAADANTLGGLPASAFALAGSIAANTPTVAAISPQAAASSVTTPGGAAGYLPVYSSATAIQDSVAFQLGSTLGINTKTPATTLDVNGSITARGALALQSTGAATTSAGKNSQPLNFFASAWDSATLKATAPQFTFQAQPAANNTSSPGATLNLLYGNGATPAQTGFSINSKGILTFAPGQTFPAASFTGTPIFSGGAASGVTGQSGGYVLGTAGVVGEAGTPSGFRGISGVWGDSYYADGVFGTSHNQAGVEGSSYSGPGVRGNSTTSDGVLGNTVGNTLGTAGVLGVAGVRTSFGGIAAVWGDADAHVGVFGSSNQYTGVYGASTSSNGVMGTTAANSANTAGVLGVNGGRTSFSGIAGVWGDAATQTGVLGTSSTYMGVFGNSVSGSGVYGASSTGNGGQFTSSGFNNGVAASNTNAFGGVGLTASAAGAYGYGVIANGTGVNGTGVYATGNLNGVQGSTSGNVLNTAGVLGLSGSRTGFNGISGVWGDAQEHVGVIGSSKDYEGVLGFSSHVGVHGIGGSSTNPSVPNAGGIIGVWGDVTGALGLDEAYAVVGSAGDTVSGYFTNNSSYYPSILVTNYGGGDGFNQNPAVVTRRPPIGAQQHGFATMELSSPGGTCGFGSAGDLSCSGPVKSLATISSGSKTVEMYSVQSPENWMEDFGTATVQNGVAKVIIDPQFAETIAANADYHVFLTPRGDSRGLYVTNLTATTFEVRESSGGKATLAFDYRIVAKRRGYEATRMADVTAQMTASRQRFTKNATEFTATKKSSESGRQ